MIPMRLQTGGVYQRSSDKTATFGQRRVPVASSTKKPGARIPTTQQEAPMEISWVPLSGSSGKGGGDGQRRSQSGNEKSRRKGVESFGAGLEKGIEEHINLGESDRQGRTHRTTRLR